MAKGGRKKSGSAKDGPKFDASVRIAVLYGKEEYLQREFTAKLKTAVEEAHGEVDVLRFDGETAAVADVLDECRSFGLMTQAKLVVVDKADQFVKGDSRPLIERYAEHPSEAATLVLRSEVWHKGKLDKLIEAGGGIVHKCDSASVQQAVGFAIARCRKRYDATIAPDAAALLVERTGTNLSRIDSEVAKLALAAGSGGAITRALVGELIGLSREEQVWDIQQEILSGEPARAVRKLHELYETARDPRDIEVPLAYALMDLGRKLTLIAAAQEQGENTRALAQEIRLWGDGERLVGAAARRAGLHAVARLFDRAVVGDARSKSGFGTHGSALERLAVEICEGVAV